MKSRLNFFAFAIAFAIALFSATNVSAQRTQRTKTDNTNININAGHVFAPKWWTDLGFTPIYTNFNKNINVWKQTFGSANHKEARIVVIGGVPYKSTVHMAESDGLPAVVEIGRKKNKKLYLVESFNHWGGGGHTLEALKTDPNQGDEFWDNVTIMAKGVKNKRAQKTPPAAPSYSSNAVAAAPAELAPERIGNIVKGSTALPGGQSVSFTVSGTPDASDGEVSFTVMVGGREAGVEKLSYTIEDGVMTVFSQMLNQTGTAKVPTTTSSSFSVTWQSGGAGATRSTYQLRQ